MSARKSSQKVLSSRDAAYHTVYYRATQVSYSMPCFEETQIPKKAMRLAMLHPLGEFSEKIPEAQFALGVINEVKQINDDYLVTVEFNGGMPGTMTMTFGWKYYSKFCVPIPEDRKKFQAARQREHERT